LQIKRIFAALYASATLVFVAASPAIAQDKGQVVVVSWGGTYQDAMREAIFKPFERATGIKVIEETGPAVAKIRAMVNAGRPEWDVADLLPQDFLQLSAEGMLQRIDYDAMDRSVFKDFINDAVQPFGVGNFVYASVISFNTKKYTRATGPKSWVDVWDVQKFPGPRILTAGNGTGATIEEALLANGIARERLYPLDFKRAYDALSRLNPSVVKWSTTSAMLTDALVSGDAAIGVTSVGRAQEAKEQGAPIDFVWNQAIIGWDYWGVLKGAKNEQNAKKFIEFASSPQSQAAMAKLQVLGPLNKKAFDLLSPERAKLLPSYPENSKHAIPLNAAWWAKKDNFGKSNREINNELWNAWILKQ
jgi:putative spermidine/putrescine transport system substrate-binding protein